MRRANGETRDRLIGYEIEIAAIGRDTEKFPHLLSDCRFLISEKRFKMFFPMARTDSVDILFAEIKKLAYRVRQRLHRAGRRLLKEDITALAAFKSKKNKSHRFIERH